MGEKPARGETIASVKKILIYVEGQTEERFVKQLLQPHLSTRGIFSIPVLATTKVVKAGPNFKGGLPAYPKVREEIQRLLRDSSAVAVTTMLDYYGLPQTFPGRNSPQGTNSYQKISFVQQEILQDIGGSNWRGKFIPFLILHEFEGLLFSSPDDIAQTLPNSENFLTNFRQIRASFNSPEEINDTPNGAPSRRIKSVYPQYRKPLHGTAIASRIGLDKIRTSCSHFSDWLQKLEGL
jgi:hypothetical protein